MAKVQLRNITRKFGAFTANDAISFDIEENTVHCIVGENGAGKSTLMNILFGLIKPDSGEIILDGEPAIFSSPHDAISRKVGMVHQHFMLIDDFTVLENVILGYEPVKGISLDLTGARERVGLLIDQYGLGLDTEEKVGNISISMQQKVEILKLLFRDSDLLIFDEPTAVLSPVEVSGFFRMVKSFKQAGKTVIVITHKLNEVKEMADRVSVLRKGKLVYEENSSTSEINIREISNAIIGGAELIRTRRKNEGSGSRECILRLNNIRLEKNKRKLLDGLSLELFGGEIHGIAGVEGNGQNEIADIVCGVEKDFDGLAELPSERAAIVPDDRLKKGLIKEFSIAENFIIKEHRNSFHKSSTLSNSSEKIIRDFEVNAPGPDINVGALSGGNQQKVVIAREIASGSSVLVFYHPTRGVDINAELFIHSAIIEQRNNGKAILLISSDIEELLGLSDRLSVIYKGKIAKVFENELLRQYSDSNESDRMKKEILINEIGRIMTGVNN